MDNTTVLPERQATKRTDTLTDFDLEEIFLERCPLIRIDGDIYCYNNNEKCFSYVDDKLLESLVRNVLREELRKIGTARKIKAVAYLLKTEQLCDCLPGELVGKLGFTNGVLDLATWELDCHMGPFIPNVKPGVKELDKHATLGERYQALNLRQTTRQLPAITYCLPIDYIDITIPNYPEASLFPDRLKEYFAGCGVTTPAADQFFNDIADGNQELVRRIYEVIGYIIVPDTKAKAFFLLQGV